MIDFKSKKVIFLLSFISAFAIYGTALHFPKFIFDDDLNIYQNWQVQHLSIANFIYFLKTSLTPIPYIVWQFISNTTGHTSTWNYRLANIIIHSLNASILFMITTKLHGHLKLKGSSPVFSLIAAFVFLFHPVQVESVVWLSSLRILLATFFALCSCAVICHLVFSKESERKSLALYSPAAIILFVLALLCKPTVLPFVVVMSFLPLIKTISSSKNSSKRSIVEQIKIILPSTVVVLFVGAITIYLHKGEVLSLAIENQTFQEKLNLILMSISSIFMNLFLPLRLVFDYQVNPFVLDYLIESNQFSVLSLFALFTMTITLSLLAIKKYRLFGISLALIFILISPHVGLVFQDFQNISTVADRYLYIAVIPLSWLLAGLFSSLQNKKIKRPLLAFSSFLLLILCLKQISLWKQPELILEASNIHDEIQTPLLVALGQNYESRGYPEIAKQYYKNALTKDSQMLGALSSLISLVNQVPSKKDSLFLINFIKKNEVELAPDDSTPFINLLISNQKFEEAQKYLLANQNLGIDPVKTQNLLFKLKNRTTELLIQSYEVLYHYHQGINRPKKALRYLKKLIKIPGAPNRLIRQYEQQLRERSGK